MRGKHAGSQRLCLLLDLLARILLLAARHLLLLVHCRGVEGGWEGAGVDRGGL